MHSLQQQKLNFSKINILLGALIVSSTFVNIVKIEFLFGRLEFFEIILFIILLNVLIYLPKKYLYNLFRERNPLDNAILVILLIYTINVLYHFTRSGLFDLMYLYILFASYFLISKSYFLNYNSKHLLSWFKIALIGAISITFIGYLVYSLSGNINSTIAPYGNYPYLGDIVRAQGLSKNPNSHAVLLALYFAFYMLANRFKPKKYDIVLISIISVALTLAKEQIILYFVIFVLLVFRSNLKHKRLLLNASSILLLITYIISINFVLCSKNCFTENWSVGPSIFQVNETWYIRPTGYFFLSKVELYAFLNNPLMGIGFGNVQHYIMKIQDGSIFPNYMPALESHILLTGLIAQFGYLSFIIIAIFIIYLSRLVECLRKINDKHLNTIFFIVFWILVFASFGLVDILFNRHIWLCLGVLSLMLNELNRKFDPKEKIT